MGWKSTSDVLDKSTWCPSPNTCAVAVVYCTHTRTSLVSRARLLCNRREEEQSGHMSQVFVAQCVQRLRNNRFCCTCAARFCWLCGAMRRACLPIHICKKSFGSEVHLLVTCFTYLRYLCISGLTSRRMQHSDAPQIYTDTQTHRNIVYIPGDVIHSPTTL